MKHQSKTILNLQNYRHIKPRTLWGKIKLKIIGIEEEEEEYPETLRPSDSVASPQPCDQRHTFLLLISACYFAPDFSQKAEKSVEFISFSRFCLYTNLFLQEWAATAVRVRYIR